MEILSQVPLVTVAELSEELNVTMETIRKDLNYLEESGQVVRIHGGAALVERDNLEIPYDKRKLIRSKEKELVAREAAKLVREGDSVLLESSTTVVALCQALVEQEELLKTLVVVTNSFTIAQMLKMGELCGQLFFLGGWIRPTESASQGSLTNSQLRKFHLNKAFLSGAALGGDLILSSYYENDMQFQKCAMECAEEVVLMLDSSKYPKAGIMTVGPVDIADYLVTNICFDKEIKEEILSKHVKLVEVR